MSLLLVYFFIFIKTKVMRGLVFSFFLTICFAYVQAQADTSLKQYTGVYKFPEGSVVPTVEVTIENGSLTASSAQGSSPLERISKDTFNLVTYSGKVYFLRNAESKIDSIRIEVQDVILEGKKDSSTIGGIIEELILKTEKYYYCVNEKSRISVKDISLCSPETIFFTLHEPVFISSSPMMITKGMFFFSAYLNCLSNFDCS